MPERRMKGQCLETDQIPYEPHRDKTNKMACAPSEDSDQPGHPPSLIRVFAVRFMGSLGPMFSSGGQRSLWSDWAVAQADLSPRWAHCHFVCFFMRRLMSEFDGTEWERYIWAATWQNQQYGLRHSKDSAQSEQSLRCALNGKLRF